MRQPWRLCLLGVDRAAVQLDDPARDREPEAGAAVGRRSGPGRAVEALEDPLGLVGGDARALVGDLDPYACSGSRCASTLDAAARRASGAPRSRRGSRPPGAALASPSSRGSGGAVEVEHARTCALAAGSRHSARDVARAAAARERASRSSGTAPDSSRERSSSCSTRRPSRSTWREHPSSAVRGRLLDAVDEVLEQRLQRGDRRPQLVGDVGDEVAAHAVGLGELGGHRVERAGELADLVARGRGDAPRVVAPRHRRGGRDHLAQRRRHPAGEEPHDASASSRGDDAR